MPGNFKSLGDADMEAPEFEYGVSCPNCFTEIR